MTLIELLTHIIVEIIPVLLEYYLNNRDKE